MVLDYTTTGKVKISMYKYISQNPAAAHLFNVNEYAKILPETTAQIFHHLVAKLLYLSMRTRHDIQMVMAISCTRVQLPDEDDYKKLTRVMQYICNTKELTLTLEPNKQPNWCAHTPRYVQS